MAVHSFVVVRLDGAALVWADCPLGGALSGLMHGALKQLIDDGVAPLVVDLVSVPAVDEAATGVLAEAAVRSGRLGAGLELRLPGGRALSVSDAATLRSAVRDAYPAPR
jgi:hypothetical protein